MPPIQSGAVRAPPDEYEAGRDCFRQVAGEAPGRSAQAPGDDVHPVAPQTLVASRAVQRGGSSGTRAMPAR